MTEGQNFPGQMPGMAPSFWGSVNQWECDENDHLNVRYYAHKVQQAVQAFLTQSGETAPPLADRIGAVHIRFVAEARTATPLRIDCAIADPAGTLLAQVHHNVSGALLAAFLVHLRPEGAALPRTPVLAVPETAGPRGIDPDDMPDPPASLADALAMGYSMVGRGVIATDECDGTGLMPPHAYIGRISDAMPNLWAFMNGAEEHAARASGNLGGAALEQRLVIHHPLAAGAVYSQLSGVRSLGNKTQHMAHLLFDHARERFAVSADAVGVAMDLTTRRAVPISEERRARLRPLLLRPRPRSA